MLTAKEIVKKSLTAVSIARASTSRTDKSFMCDKNYDELNSTESSMDCDVKNPTSAKKLERLKSIKEKSFEYKKSAESDSISSLIADLHVELIFLYHKLSLRLLEFKDLKAKKEVTFDAEFDNLLSECKKNKISQSLLLMSKALYLNSMNFLSEANKVQDEQKSLIEVNNNNNNKKLNYSFFH